MPNKYLQRNDLIKLDKELKMNSLTSNLIFKEVFLNDLELLKEFLILETELDLNPKETRIILSEDTSKYQSDINIYISVSLNKTFCFQVGLICNNYRENQNFICLKFNTKNLNLEPDDDIVIIEAFALKAIFKYLTFYKILYYKLNVKLNKEHLWLVAILSRNFTELYDLLGNLLTDEKRDKFIRKVIEISKTNFGK